MENRLETVLYDFIPHVRQLHSWDCGIACVAMIFTGITRNHQIGIGNASLNSNLINQEHFYTVVKRLQTDDRLRFGKRPWTIDLCNLLNHLNVQYKYFTSVKQGTDNNDLSKLKFYSNSLKKDVHRIRNLLQYETELNENITVVNLNDESFLCKCKNGPAIVLVDETKICCKHCDNTQLTKWFSKKTKRKPRFVGHYVLVIGFKLEGATSTIYYRNSSVAHNICCMNMTDFNVARLAFGTEGDVIAINMKENVTN